jgi:hypothetical protein
MGLEWSEPALTLWNTFSNTGRLTRPAVMVCVCVYAQQQTRATPCEVVQVALHTPLASPPCSSRHKPPFNELR